MIIYKDGKEVSTIRGKLSNSLGERNSTLTLVIEENDEEGFYTYDCIILYQNNLNDIAAKISLVDLCTDFPTGVAKIACLALLLAAEGLTKDGDEPNVFQKPFFH